MNSAFIELYLYRNSGRSHSQVLVLLIHILLRYGVRQFIIYHLSLIIYLPFGHFVIVASMENGQCPNKCQMVDVKC